MRYIVMLRDCNDADSSAVSLAVDRFRHELDRWLDTRFKSALLAFQRASDTDLEELSQSDRSLALEFGAAYQAAQSEGLAVLHHNNKAYFEILVP